MSARLKMTSEAAENLSHALGQLTDMTVETGCIVTGAELQLPGEGSGSLAIAWDDELTEYLVDDRSGS